MKSLMINNKNHQRGESVAIREYSNMTLCAGVLISLFPILAPYRLFGVSLNWILGLMFVALHCIARKNFPILNEAKPLAVYTIASMLISVNGLLVLSNSSNLINAEIAMLLDLIIYLVLWYYSDIDVTIKYANLFAYICCGYAFIQILATISGSAVPLGQLPVFEVSSGWIPETWGYRFNSLFSEPSYFAIYLLPVFIYNFVKNNWLNTIVFGIFIILTSSSLGIVSLIVVLLMSFFKSDFSFKKKISFLLIVFFVIGLIAFLSSKVPMVSSFITRSFSKIEDIFDSSSNGGFAEDVRLGGYLYLFGDLPLKEQLFGVGNAQLQNYFAERGLYIHNYSNSFVLSLLNFGIIGFSIFMVFMGQLLYVSRKEKKRFVSIFSGCDFGGGFVTVLLSFLLVSLFCVVFK